MDTADTKPALRGLLEPAQAPVLDKADLIRLIQYSEGQQECFGSAASAGCQRTGCVWSEECRSTEE